MSCTPRGMQEGACMIPRCAARRTQTFLGVHEQEGQSRNAMGNTGSCLLKDVERQEVFCWRGERSDLTTRETLVWHMITEPVLLKKI